MNLDSNQIDDLTTLSDKEMLSKLILSNNQIADISHLGILRFDHYFIIIDLSNNFITSGITNINADTNIRRIDLIGNNSILCSDLEHIDNEVDVVVRPSSCIE